MSETNMPNAVVTFCIALFGAELTAMTFIACLDPGQGPRSLYVPVLGILSTFGASLAGLLAWPLIHSSFPNEHRTRFVACLYAITLGGTYLTVEYGRFGLIGPIASFLIALLVARMLTRPRVLVHIAN